MLNTGDGSFLSAVIVIGREVFFDNKTLLLNYCLIREIEYPRLFMVKDSDRLTKTSRELLEVYKGVQSDLNVFLNNDSDEELKIAFICLYDLLFGKIAIGLWEAEKKGVKL